ncbi:MAG: alpha/beta fold hydrolase [Candidatus Eisenbacteria bacterium]|uniref:Alpha/beta fold hydrolase n=1 Tax=Eiseniibacteriota bacterium TaxID=2212470 RepID=A0A538SUB3_UNCEI|nr:MAG: alpha/beta fold hydrolase [Candidatus Eisenbacteria bacterium]
MEPAVPASRHVTSVEFQGPVGRMEGLWSDPGRGLPAAVIAHPHPAHGGSMHSKVVYTIYRVLDQAGHPTLRFHFRGVGKSEGAYSGWNEEKADVAAAAAYARERTGRRPLWGAGFSFGAWVGLQWALGDPEVERFIAVGLAANDRVFDFLDRVPWPLAIVQGERDQYGSPAALAELTRTWERTGKVTVRIVQGADHFFTGKLTELTQALEEIL